MPANRQLPSVFVLYEPGGLGWVMLEGKGTNGSRDDRGGGAIHEFQNLISIIIAEAQLLQAGLTEDEPNYASAVAIEQAGRRLERLVDRLVGG